MLWEHCLDKRQVSWAWPLVMKYCFSLMPQTYELTALSISFSLPDIRLVRDLAAGGEAAHRALLDVETHDDVVDGDVVDMTEGADAALLRRETEATDKPADVEQMS